MIVPFGKHIIDLLKAHECVVLPELGALLLKNVPAHISAGQVFPASKSIVFNSNILSEDNLLVSKLVNNENLSFLDAKLETSKFISVLKFDLTQKGFFEIENLGRFSTSNNVVNFVSNSNLGLLNKQNFGFETISAFVVPREIIIEKEEKKEKETAFIPVSTKQKRSIRKGALAGLVATFLIMIAISGLMFTNTTFTNLKVQNANVLNFLVPSSSLLGNDDGNLKRKNKTEKIKKGANSRKTINQEDTNDSELSQKLDSSETYSANNKIAGVSEKIDPEYREILKVNSENPDGYYIVIGAYSDLANANKAKYECSINNACSVFRTDNNMYRVGIYTSTEKMEAINIIKEFKKSNNSYWLMQNN